MTFYKGLFHDAIEFLRNNGISVPIIVGGPYPTASYAEILEDRNINLVVIAEGERVLVDILSAAISNGKKLPPVDELKDIPGLAFYTGNSDTDSVHRG